MLFVDHLCFFRIPNHTLEQCNTTHPVLFLALGCFAGLSRVLAIISETRCGTLKSCDPVGPKSGSQCTHHTHAHKRGSGQWQPPCNCGANHKNHCSVQVPVHTCNKQTYIRTFADRVYGNMLFVDHLCFFRIPNRTLQQWVLFLAIVAGFPCCACGCFAGLSRVLAIISETRWPRNVEIMCKSQKSLQVL